MPNKPTETAIIPASKRSLFGKIVIVIMLLIVLSCCLGTLGICYSITTKGVDVRVNGGNSTNTSSANIVELFCNPFASAISQIFDSIFRVTR